jgi:hypothetical protein
LPGGSEKLLDPPTKHLYQAIPAIPEGTTVSLIVWLTRRDRQNDAEDRLFCIENRTTPRLSNDDWELTPEQLFPGKVSRRTRNAGAPRDLQTASVFDLPATRLLLPEG